MRSVEQVAISFDAACRDAGVLYAFVGGVAVMAWGQPRATTDVDALVSLPPAQVDVLARKLRDRALDVDPQDLRDALRENGHASAFDRHSAFHVDIAFARRPEEVEEVARGTDLQLPGGRVRVVGPEDTVAFKLRFGSEQDLKDARSILVRQDGRLDEERLQAVAQRLGVSGALAEMRAHLRAQE